MYSNISLFGFDQIANCRSGQIPARRAAVRAAQTRAASPNRRMPKKEAAVAGGFVLTGDPVII
jgi:hypothetical protein